MILRSLGALGAFLALCACLLLQYTGNFGAPESPLVGTLIWAVLLASGLFGARLMHHDTLPLPHGKPAALALGAFGLVSIAGGVAMGSTHDILFLGGALIGSAALALAVHAAHKTARPMNAAVFARAGLGTALALLWMYWPLSGATYQGLALLPSPGPLNVPLLLAMGTLLIVAWGGAGRRRAWILAAALAAGTLCMRSAGIQAWEIHPQTRDMLALIQSAQDVALSGHNPYAVYQMQHTSEVPLTYLPVLWLSSLPLRALALDMRWLHVLADASVPLGLWWSTRGRAQQAEGVVNLESGVALGLGALWMMLPSVQWNTIYAEPSLWWGLLCWLLAARARGKSVMVAVLLGVALCTRHFAVILLPFFLVEWWVIFGWKRAAVLTSISGAICAVLLTPFVAADPEIFWFGTLTWLRDYGPVHQTWFYDKFGFAKLLYESGWITRAPLLQAAGVLGGLGLSVWLARKPEWRARGVVMWPAALSYTLFVMCNGLIWYSFFVGLVLCVTLLRTQPLLDPPRVSTRQFQAALAALVISLCCGGYIVYTLAVQGAHPGLDEIKAELATRQVDPAQLIDDHARQLEFVTPEPLLAPTLSVWSHLQRTERGQTRALWHVRNTTRSYDPLIDVWSTSDSSFERPRGIIAFEPVQRVQHGIYQMELVTLPSYQGKLSEQLHSGSFSAAYLNGDQRTELVSGGEGQPFVAMPTLPGWSNVQRRACAVTGAQGAMIFAHPRDGEELELVWRDVKPRAMIVVMGGIEDEAVRWGKADVTLDVQVTHPQRGTRQGRVDLLNRPGLRGLGLDVREFSGESVSVTITISTPDAGQRWTCIDALVF